MKPFRHGEAGRRGMFATCFAAIVLALFSSVASAQVLAVLSEGSAAYEAVADQLRAGLHDVRGGRLHVDTVAAARLQGVDAAAWSRYQVVVTVGLAAAQAAVPREEAQPAGPPILCLLIPRQSFARLPGVAGVGGERRVSAVYIDQPLARQIELLRIALPERHRIGVILGPSSRELADDLRSEADKRALTVAYATVDERAGLYPALQKLIPESDLLLLLPDPVAINADTIYGLLLTTYRAEVPVVGFSDGLLNAGALMSLFSTAQQQGRQGAEIVRGMLTRAAGVPPPQYPRYFTVRVNASVARSLGLHVPAEAELQAALEANRTGQAQPHAANVRVAEETP